VSLSKTARFRILARDNFTCRYCGRFAPNVELEVDHIVPQALGGDDDPDNLVTACHDCNNGKRADLLPSRRRPSVAHPDACHECHRQGDPLRSYAAYREEWTSEAGYRAWYRCDVDHQWSTGWEKNLRIPADMLATEIAAFNSLYPEVAA
jgi:hypothetical protein